MTERDVNKPPTKAELQQYIHQYKLEAQRDANADMDKLFGQSNALEQKLGSDLIIFASVILIIMGGIIASREVVLSSPVKVVLTAGFVILLASILAGLVNYRSMSDFWLEWAKAKHERGSIIENDHSKTFDDLVALRKQMMDHERKLPQTSPKLFSRIQITCFVSGLLLVVGVIIGILFDISFMK